MSVLITKPIITEKAMKLAAHGIYTFAVSKDATKLQIAKAVVNKFKVKVLSVKTINIKGTLKMQRQFRGYYQTAPLRKAMVQVKKGDKIGLFETEQAPQATVTTADNQVVKEKKSLLRGTKVKVEKVADIPMPTTQRKVITGK